MKRTLLLAAVLIATFVSSIRAAERPNMLFILSDDHAQEAIGAYGSWLKDYVQTPVIDKLAAEGMRFTNMCVNNSICSPSRAAILTGQYSHKNIRCVAAIDDNMQRLFDYLEEQELTDDTLIVYTSDQGYWLGQHGLYDKRLILDESLKMPLIVRYPREIAAGSVNSHLCSNVDFAPTLLDYAGVAAPSAMQGRSLRPLLRGESPDDWRKAIWYAYWGAPPNHWGVRTADSTLVRFPDTDEIEFYDLKTDPRQTRSVHADPTYASRIAATHELLAATIREVEIQATQLPGGRAANAANGQKKTKTKNKKQDD